MRKDVAKLTLTIGVEYELGCTDVRDLEQMLVRAADHLANEGLLSGETEASVTSWWSTVEETK